MAVGGGDLLIRVKFAGDDRLSKMLNGIGGASQRAGRAIGEANKALRQQKNDLRDVERQIAGGSGNITGLIEKERLLERSIVATNKQIERQGKIIRIESTVGRATHLGEELVGKGMGTLFSTALLAAPLIEAAKAGAEFRSFQDRMGVLGLGHAAVDDLTKFARAMDVAGSSVNDNMRYLLEAQGVFRETGENSLAKQLAGAKLMAPLLAKMHVVYGSMGKEMGEEEERYLLRFVEQSGGLTSPKRAMAIADGVFRAMQSSGGNVQAKDYQGFKAHAGIGGFHLSDRAMFADFEPLIAELHEQAGVGLATAFKQATGIKVNKQAAAEYLKLGLWDQSKVKLNSQGAVKSTNGNPLNAKAAHLLDTDPVEFYRQIMLPAYAKAGIKTDAQRSFENAKIFGGTGGNLYNLIDKQLPTLLKSRESYKKTQGLDAAYNATNNSFFGQEGKLRAAAKDFMVAAGSKGGLLDSVVTLMNGATAALKTFTALGNAHPTAFAWLGKIVVWLLALRALRAVGQIVFGGMLGPAVKLWGFFAKWKAAGSLFEAFPAIARGAALAGKAFGFLRVAAMFLARGVMQAGMMMLANPIVLAITAIVVVLGVAGYLIYKHWDTIKAAFWGAVAWCGRAIGNIVAAFKSFGPKILLGLGPIGFAAGMLIQHWSAVKSFFAGLWTGIVAGFGKAVAFFRTLPGIFATIGKFLLQGLIDSLNPALVVQRIVKMGSLAVAALKNVLGIHSPSRVFAEIGGHMMGGLALGIERGAAHPLHQVRRAGVGLIAAAGVAIVPAHASRVERPARLALGGDHHHYQIIIHQQPGESADELADKVMRRIDEKRARAERSSYQDDD